MLKLLFILMLFVASPLLAQDAPARINWAEQQPHWAAPAEPFNIIGNLYYVGTEGLSVYLITGPNGHALIDGGLAGGEQTIIDNIAALGFDIEDVKYLFNTHAHFDHAGGLAALKGASGAELWASAGDVSALEGGFYLGSEDVADYLLPPVTVDHIIDVRKEGESGEVFSFSENGAGKPLLLTALTPGHSRGCTSFRLFIDDENEHLEVLIFCSASVAANRLVASDQGPAQYDGIVDAYQQTFETTVDWTPDIFLSNHADVFDLKDKRLRQIAGDRRAFVDRGAFQKYIVEQKNAFEAALAEQSAAAKK